MGAEALLHIIRNLDLNALAKELRDEIHTSGATSQRRKKAIKRLRVVEAFRKNGPRAGVDDPDRAAGDPTRPAADGAA